MAQQVSPETLPPMLHCFSVMPWQLWLFGFEVPSMRCRDVSLTFRLDDQGVRCS